MTLTDVVWSEPDESSREVRQTWTALREQFRIVTTELVDDETATAGVAALRAVYAAAVQLVAPRVLERIASEQSRIHPLVAAGGGAGDQIITDDEWSTLVDTVTDTLGDSVLDGVIAGAATFAKLPPVAAVGNAVLGAVKGLLQFGSQLRQNINGWIANRIGEGVTGDWGIGSVIDALTKSSPLSQSTADGVAATQLQAANNAGLFAALDAVQPAALRWVTRRDDRVRDSHVAADKETIPYGETFTIDGYPAKFPGDPDLPFAQRVNCRCTLAYVDGTEARRVVGSTTAELRAKATAMSISGRSKMNKGQLQTALLKSLCLQGFAGGPDCPDNFDQMNRTALLTVARGEAIPGRHSMTRGQLVYSLRQSLRGGDTALVARGYAPRAEFTKAQHLASYKRGRAPVPGEFASTTIPSPEARRAERPALFEQFGGKAAGSVPCVHCGLRLSDDPASGLAMLVPEPIVPWSQGGSLSLDNLVPSCPSCFRSRGGRGLVSSGAELTHEGAIQAWKSRGKHLAVDRAELTHEGALLAWDVRGRAVTRLQFGELAPKDRGKAPADWFANPAEKKATQKRFDDLIDNVPQPTADEVAKKNAAMDQIQTGAIGPKGGKLRPGGDFRGSGPVRRVRKTILVREFSTDGKGTHCPCVHCGLKISLKGEGGFASLSEDKILTTREGGGYGTPSNHPNVVPACVGCNKSRNDTPLERRPKWDTKVKKRTKKKALVAAGGVPDGLVITGKIVTAFPMGWDEPDWDVCPAPVRGLLAHRTVSLEWGDYEQWLVGGECVDPTTIDDGDGVVASATAFTHEGAVKAWDVRGRSTGDERAQLDEFLASGKTGAATVTYPGGGTHTVHKFPDQQARNAAMRDAIDEVPDVDQAGFNAYDDAQRSTSHLTDQMVFDQILARANYIADSGMVNRMLKYGTDGFEESDIETATATAEHLSAAIAEHGVPAPPALMRGKTASFGGPLRDLGYEVGQTFTEPGFGSWTARAAVARNFAGTDYSANGVVTVLDDTRGQRSMLGEPSEHESILPTGMSYRVTSIEDMVSPEGTLRMLHVAIAR